MKSKKVHSADQIISSKILGTILKIYKGRTLMNGTEDKKVDDNVQCRSRDDIYRLCVSREEGGRGLANPEESVDASVRGLEDYIKKAKKDKLHRPATTLTN